MVSKEQVFQIASKLFDDYDTDNSGFLDQAEVKVIFRKLFSEVVKNIDVSDKKIQRLFQMSDMNSDRKLSRKEFRKILQLFLEPIYL